MMNTVRALVRSTFLLLAVVALLVAGRPALAEAPPEPALGPEWAEALETLHRLPVQDTGFVRTSHSFAQNLVSAIAGKRTIGKADSLESLLFLLANPDLATRIQLIKISHPDLVAIYGAPRISVEQWRDMKHRDALMRFVQEDQEQNLKPLNSIEYRAQLLEDLEGEFAIVPRPGEWLSPSAAQAGGELSPGDMLVVMQWEALLDALSRDDAQAGAAASESLVEAVAAAATEIGADMPPIAMELFYYSHHPFRKAAVFYLFSALLFSAGLLTTRRGLAWAGMALLAIGFVEHAVGLGIRWQLAGRGPLSNMYESFVFAIGGMVLVALVLEASRMVRLAGLAAAVLGFCFMVVAHKAPIFDSQIRPLMPALQSTWLTYHVVTIMLSYSAFALSFFVALVYLLKDKVLGGDNGKSLLARRLPSLQALDTFNFRIIGIGFPLLTLGIITGAIWAATAWGRPWGFDPKETWSAITWLVYAVYLHVRYLSGWSGRSAAVLSVVGFLAVLFTYLGVNYLLSGLHSYV